MSDNFPLLLPTTMITFGIVFLAVWHRGGNRAALWWGASYIVNGLAFTCDALLSIYPADWFSWFGDSMFFVSFLLYGQGLVEHFGWRWCLKTRLAIATFFSALCFWALFVRGDLALELAASDLGCACLLAVPIFVRGRPVTRGIDRALIALNVFDIVDSLMRVVTVHETAPTSLVHFLTSEYAVLVHTTGTISGLVNAVLALAAVTLNVVDGYRDAASTDPLTGLLNRRGFKDSAQRLPLGGSVMSCDIDRFKSINDRFGHAVGDRVIAVLAASIASHLPDGAIAARFGGDEFVIYLPTHRAVMAAAVANAIRHDLSAAIWPERAMPAVTASFGVADVGAMDGALNEAVARADHALYAAKQAGRDRTVLQPIASLETKPAIQLVA